MVNSGTNAGLPILPRWQGTDIMKGGLSLGMVVGQLLFGVLSDVWGRHTIYGKELLLTIFGTLMVVLLPWNRMSAQSVTTWVSIFRVVTGVGIGAGKSMFPWDKDV